MFQSCEEYGRTCCIGRWNIIYLAGYLGAENGCLQRPPPTDEVSGHTIVHVKLIAGGDKHGIIDIALGHDPVRTMVCSGKLIILKDKESRLKVCRHSGLVDAFLLYKHVPYGVHVLVNTSYIHICWVVGYMGVERCTSAWYYEVVSPIV